ncbi:MAG: hypothetical protein JEY91_14945 [Spirochaetaceae bacterium]|nr:hypothetical protein [Spirochaetaceae bacterium]
MTFSTKSVSSSHIHSSTHNAKAQKLIYLDFFVKLPPLEENSDLRPYGVPMIGSIPETLLKPLGRIE